MDDYPLFVVDFDSQEILQQIPVLKEQLNVVVVVVLHEFFVLIFLVVAEVFLRKKKLIKFLISKTILLRFCICTDKIGLHFGGIWKKRI
jgi:hypothetical protein